MKIYLKQVCLLTGVSMNEEIKRILKENADLMLKTIALISGAYYNLKMSY